MESAIVCHGYDDAAHGGQESLDVPSIWRCHACGYLGKSKSGLSMHRVVVHSALQPINYCVDSAVCSVCGLIFSSILAATVHVAEPSEICLNNLLRRGAFLSPSQVQQCREEIIAVRLAKTKSGKILSKRCCRTFWPAQASFRF